MMVSPDQLMLSSTPTSNASRAGSASTASATARSQPSSVNPKSISVARHQPWSSGHTRFADCTKLSSSTHVSCAARAPGTGGSAGAAGPTPARHPPGPGSAPGPRRSSDRGGAPRPRRLPRTRSPPTPRRSRPQTPAGARPARRGRGAGDGHPAATGSGGAGCRTCGSTAPGDAGRVHWTQQSPASGVHPAGGAGPAHTPRSPSAPWHPPEPQPVPTAAAGARAKPTGRRPSCGEAGPYRKGKAVAPHS